MLVVDTEQHVQIWNMQGPRALGGGTPSEANREHVLALDTGLPVERLRQPIRSVLTDEESRVELDAKQAAVDGQRQEFDQGGVRRATVHIPPEWDGPNLPGKNHGTAGMLFGAEASRGFAGGQQARSIQVAPFRPLR